MAALLIRPEAEADLAAAKSWYEAQRPGLGARFLERVDETLSRIQQAPELYAVVHKTARQAKLHRFPYVVCYQTEPDLIVVLAVVHVRRDPGFWRSRA